MSDVQRYEIMDDGDLYMNPHGTLCKWEDVDKRIAEFEAGQEGSAHLIEVLTKKADDAKRDATVLADIAFATEEVPSWDDKAWGLIDKHRTQEHKPTAARQGGREVRRSSRRGRRDER